MSKELQHSYLQEIEYQKKMLSNLERWLKVCFVVSSFTVLLIYFGAMYSLLKLAGGIFLGLVVIVMVLIGFALRNGRRNLNKVISALEKQI